MTISELITELSGFNPDSPVRLATQPAYPFEYTISAIVQVYPDAEFDMEDDEGMPVVYIAEGSQEGYLSGEAAAELGW